MKIKEENFSVHRKLDDKEIKNLTLLEHIRTKGPISRTDLSKLTQINMVSISNYVKNYISKGIVSETGYDISSGGRRAEMLEVNVIENYVLGIELRAQEAVLVLTDLKLDIIEKVKTERQKDEDKFEVKLLYVIEDLFKRHNTAPDNVRGIGIGVSGDNDKCNSACSFIKEKLAREVFLGNDAKVAALGERTLNRDSGVDTLLYIYSHLGCGIVFRGNTYFGHDFTDGESQPSMEAARYLRPWGFNLGIIKTSKSVVDKGVGTEMVRIAGGRAENITNDVIIEAAGKGDVAALGIIETAGLNLGLRIAYLVNLFSPDVIMVGGGIEEAGDIIFNPIKKAVERFASQSLQRSTKIMAGKLGEDAVSLGAASLAIREIFLSA
ncbi:MAG: hypothetical protein A2987_02670 [Omnitrophica bacterium RIFCSPLOWO2_01_FULL_45_10]|nr:MAG: hypothetical protein A2987_02670 [Omnitrophica bacterium RIFCSPLOWO2_01_FULL_45_10]